MCVSLLMYTQTDQGIRNLSVDRAAELAGTQPDYSITDLFKAIASGQFVSRMYVCGGEGGAEVDCVIGCMVM